MSITIGEITTPWDHNMITSVDCMVFHGIVIELLGFDVSVESFESWVTDSWAIIASLIIAHVSKPPVLILEAHCPDFNIRAESVVHWSLDPLSLLVSMALSQILPVHTAKEPGIEAHLSKESGIGVGVTERINLPADARSVTELFEQELLTNHHVVHHIIDMSAGFIMHGPSSIYELKSVLFD